MNTFIMGAAATGIALSFTHTLAALLILTCVTAYVCHRSGNA